MAADDDGYRALVDGMWPRGIKKEGLKADEWLKDIAPSKELRQWFDHDPAKFDQFARQYRQEVEQSGLAEGLLERARGASRLTLVYSAKDEQHNQAVVLRNYLEELQ